MSGITNFIAESGYQDILRKLISINSCNGNEREIVNTILSIMPKNFNSYHVIDHGNDRASLVLVVKGETASGGIAFIGHMDTVSAGNEDSWRHPPFTGAADAAFMYGRGSADMKSGITAMIVTALYFIKNNIIPAKDIYFCFTADEESKGIGISSIRDEGYLNRVNQVIIPEPSNNMLSIAEKGALWLRFEAYGKSSHASRPDEGLNAAEQLLEFIASFKSLVLVNAIPDELLGNTTVVITQFQSGIANNIVPEYALATVDIRTIAGSEHRDIIAAAEHLIVEQMSKNPGLRLTVKVENNRPSVSTSTDAPMVRELQELLSLMGMNSRLVGTYFYSDASQLIPHLKVPFVILGPGEDTMAHKINERVELNSVAKIAEVYIRYLLRKEG